MDVKSLVLAEISRTPAPLGRDNAATGDGVYTTFWPAGQKNYVVHLST